MATPIEISTFTLCIVGARYRLSSDYLRKWLATLVGTDINIREDERNISDPFAVAAWTYIDDDPKKIGFVRSEDREIALRLLRAYGKPGLPTKVTKVIGDQGTFIVEVSGITPVPKDSLKLVPKWEEWETCVPSMTIPDEFEKEDFAYEVVESLLQKGMDADADLLRKRLASYIKVSGFDISLETRQHREYIKAALRERKDADDWKDERRQLRCQSGEMGNATFGGEIWKTWMDFIRHPNFSPSFKKNTFPTKKEVENCLYKFPLAMWTTWISDPDKFVSRLYYACIPRKVLWSFISTIAFYNLLTSTTAPSIVLTPWGEQSKQMPDNVLDGLYTGMAWLQSHGNDIPSTVMEKMSREIRDRIDSRQKEAGKATYHIECSKDSNPVFFNDPTFKANGDIVTTPKK